MVVKCFFRPITLLLAALAPLLPSAFLSATSGCSSVGASAPPISLPAPVTGRMTVSSPDESGVALIVGDEGAVPAGALVHAVNNSKDTVAFRVLEKTLLGWVATAQAQAFPEICTRAFHACTLADATGSFELSVQAALDEEIIVEILDPSTGARISDQFHHAVPSNVRFFQRPINALGLLVNTITGDHTLYALMPHADGGTRGLVSVVNVDTEERTVVDFDGPNPTRMVVESASRTAAVLDPSGEFIAKVDLTTNNFDSPFKASLAAPRDMILNTTGSTLYVTTGETIDSGTSDDARFIRSFNYSTGAEGDPIRISFLQAAIPGATHLETLAIDLRTFTDGAIVFDIAAFVGMYSVDGDPTPAVGLFDADTMTFLTAIPLANGTLPEDVALSRSSDQILVTDAGNDRIYLFDFTYIGGVATITPAGSVDDPAGLIENPKDILTLPEQPFAFVTAKNGTDDRPDTVLTIVLDPPVAVVDINPIGLTPSDAVIDPLAQAVFFATLKSHSIAFWGIPELLP
jgi:DNA-binding beta-propeller fold protein YncE